MKRKVFICVVLSVLILVGVFYYRNYGRVKNVFDEIYYSELKLMNRGAGATPNPSLANVENIVKSPWGSDNKKWYDDGGVSEFYIEGILGEDKQLSVRFNKKELTVVLFYTINLDERVDMDFKYDYSVDTKVLYQIVEIYDGTLSDNRVKKGDEIYPYLEKYGISIDEVKRLSDEGLYDIFLTDWFEGNSEYSKFSMDDLGDIEIIKDSILE